MFQHGEQKVNIYVSRQRGRNRKALSAYEGPQAGFIVPLSV